LIEQWQSYITDPDEAYQFFFRNLIKLTKTERIECIIDLFGLLSTKNQIELKEYFTSVSKSIASDAIEVDDKKNKIILARLSFYEGSIICQLFEGLFKQKDSSKSYFLSVCHLIVGKNISYIHLAVFKLLRKLYNEGNPNFSEKVFTILHKFYE
jgi:hypothetical protein